ncbi:MAG: hypothetical protein Q4A62_07445 [Eikenella sp.]|nr:hypothetical protein [Eikenella sp.]
MNPPTILLGMPPDNQIFRLIETNLRHHGFEVVNIVDDGSRFRYPSLYARLQTKLRQLLLQDQTAKQHLRDRQASQHIHSQLDRYGHFDYGLFIRADIYPRETLSTIRKHIRYSMVNYQWDGLQRYPDIQSRISLFNRFYVFDPSDVAGSLLPNTNFYFDHDLADLPDPTTDFYFVGSHLDSRMPSIAAFARKAREKGWKLDFQIYCGSKKQGSFQHYRSLYPDGNIRLLNHHKSFQENLDSAKRAKVLVDFKAAAHNGLSFRVFEALGYQRKLITTNADVAKYDFYHPDNIFIWDGVHFDGMEEFLVSPYHVLNPDIRSKYSFGNWIRYVLNLPPYQAIRLPATE